MNTIEIDEKGIFCYKAPELNSRLQYEPVIQKQQYQIDLEQAKRDRVYFKDLILMEHLIDDGNALKTGKPYPIPDGYEVRIEWDFKSVDGGEGKKVQKENGKYAILVPKEKDLRKSLVKQILETTKDFGKEEQKQQSLKGMKKEILRKAFDYGYWMSTSNLYNDSHSKNQAFEQWYEQFKQREVMNRWISVKDSLPGAKQGWQHSEQVLVYYQGTEHKLEGYGIAYYNYNPPFAKAGFIDFARYGDQPTHWSVLPKFPTT